MSKSGIEQVHFKSRAASWFIKCQLYKHKLNQNVAVISHISLCHSGNNNIMFHFFFQAKDDTKSTPLYFSIIVLGNHFFSLCQNVSLHILATYFLKVNESLWFNESR